MRAKMGETVDALACKADVKTRVKESLADRPRPLRRCGGLPGRELLPSTKIEDERVGPLADQVKETAAETGKEALHRGKEVASEVAGQAVDVAKEAGGEAVDTAKGAARARAVHLIRSPPFAR